MKINRQKIELEMARQGISTTQLAEKAGIARQNISTVLGRGTCTPPTAGKLAKALGVDIEAIAEEV